jgi:hypothetical protein
MGAGDGHKDQAGRLFHGGYWLDSWKWPPPQVSSVNYYFHADCSLTRRPPGGDEPGATTYSFDPAHPVSTIGGGVSKRLKDGAFDQRERDGFPGSRAPFLPLRSRADVLVFETEPLSEDTEVIGPIEIELFAASTAVDTDFSAKLVDVYPPSFEFPSGIRHEFDRRHHPRELSWRSQAKKTDAARRRVLVLDPAVRHGEPLQERAPNPRRHLEQQLPQI